MQRVTLNHVMNKEVKYYGLKLIGLIIGGVLGIFALLVINMTFAIAGAIIGYGIGAWFSSLMHQGKLQRWIYWNLPVKFLFRKSPLPPSHIRTFM